MVVRAIKPASLPQIENTKSSTHRQDIDFASGQGYDPIIADFVLSQESELVEIPKSRLEVSRGVVFSLLQQPDFPQLLSVIRTHAVDLSLDSLPVRVGLNLFELGYEDFIGFRLFLPVGVVFAPHLPQGWEAAVQLDELHKEVSQARSLRHGGWRRTEAVIAQYLGC